MTDSDFNQEETMMLILSRKAGESVFVGEMTVEVIRIQGGRVKLAFRGPEEIPVFRAELEARGAAAPQAVNVEEAAA